MLLFYTHKQIRRKLPKYLKKEMKQIYKCARITVSHGSRNFDTEEEKSKEDIKRKVTRFLKFLGTVLAGYFFGCDELGVKGRFVRSVENAVRHASGTFGIHFNHVDLFSIVSKCKLLLKELENEQSHMRL